MSICKKKLFFFIFLLTNSNKDIIIVIVVRHCQVIIHADVAELADAQDLKSCGG